MGTQATITVKTGETYKTICTNWDGYPSHHMPILTEHYNNQESAEALVNLGDLSVLAESTECPNGHTFQTPIKGHCIAYGRDRGEKNTDATQSNSLSMAGQLMSAEFNYLWNGSEWSISQRHH